MIKDGIINNILINKIAQSQINVNWAIALYYNIFRLIYPQFSQFRDFPFVVSAKVCNFATNKLNTNRCMKHIVFNSFDEFFAHFNLPKNGYIRIGSGENAYFEFQPYNDGVTIRGWVHEVSRIYVEVEFKYKEFRLGRKMWSLEDAKENIKKVYYYYEDYED
jgi:hypothetical protein